mmetsp:Transcript_12668/g.17611  ORF Transcript_12668/g.17611 Transcript_12668/m.17611 type:complete len:83 (-) Transcript_12668:189-437(-)
MVGTPVFLNIIQLIIQDTCLKKQEQIPREATREREAVAYQDLCNQDKLPLIRVPDSDGKFIASGPQFIGRVNGSSPSENGRL